MGVRDSIRTSGCPNSNPVRWYPAGSGGMLTVKGFTLIEILVVLFIISIMTGIALVNLPGFMQSGDFDAEADRLKVVLEMLRDEALIQANEYGFKPEPDGYQFFIYNELQQQWDLLEERPFTERNTKNKIQLSLNVEGDELRLGENDEAPPILILSSGEITPFELEVHSGTEAGSMRVLVSDGYGAISWRNDNEFQE